MTRRERLERRIDEIEEEIGNLEREKESLIHKLEEIEAEELERAYVRKGEVLAMLREGPMSNREINERLGITFPIRRLEKEGLVKYSLETEKWELISSSDSKDILRRAGYGV